ncbi:3-hydroxyacyl-CoA dehydrogenase [Microbacterium sp. cf046]|uniref:3-hydroxyacyl-CoA dehydrogenase NAD-binding domain-containing protein n=1 Tax=Microbacterium sp. cf046 TaxID=1761803 RepID=UPI0008EA7340|nr:3-hydroxyacyl-CoA dehydrogenase NAD-binding domain-containing protein [Microbacterium sp. cf046]SFS16777.1 3-hydroxyacyl-CoA dehydrogenase [Microbacterium sp. cf046]
MTNYSEIDFSPLDALTDDEVVTHSPVRDIRLPSGKVLALITLDNGRDHTRPNTLGPTTLTELGATLDALRARAAAGEIQAVGITGKQYILAAGADLSQLRGLSSGAQALLVGQLGHHVLGTLSELGVPSFAFINGLALGGGLELALHAAYRTIDASARAIGLPEVSLGLVPGWGGAYLLPNLIGIHNALEIIVVNPLRQNRLLSPSQAFDYGIVDTVVGAVNFLEDSLRWADGVLDDDRSVTARRSATPALDASDWSAAVATTKEWVNSRVGVSPTSPYAALELLDKARSGSKEEGFEREDEVLADLVTGDQFSASMYAFDLVQKRAKRPVGAPDKALAKRMTKVGIIGAGLMASQFALLFVRKLQVPVLITDLDQARVDKGVAYIHDEIDALEAKGRLDGDSANKLRALVTGTTDKSLYADCDFVIEAVFEEVGVKQAVFGEIEQHVAEDAILATNTSSLSVEEIGEKLVHPERLVGFHFFNPAAVMPLIEIVKTPLTTDAALSTAFVVAKGLGKNAVLTADAPGFVVNRLLAKVMGEAARAVYEGTPLLTVEKAFAPIGLPMSPFQLIDLVGWKVAAHVQDTMAHAFPDRFYTNENLHRLAELPDVVEKGKGGRITGWTAAAAGALEAVLGSAPASEAEILQRVQDGLAQEIKIMLDEGVVPEVEDIDLCLILGAGWPFIDGGASPYLDREGASTRVFDDTFHHPAIKGIAGILEKSPSS